MGARDRLALNQGIEERRACPFVRELDTYKSGNGDALLWWVRLDVLSGLAKEESPNRVAQLVLRHHPLNDDRLNAIVLTRASCGNGMDIFANLSVANRRDISWVLLFLIQDRPGEGHLVSDNDTELLANGNKPQSRSLVGRPRSLR